MRHERFNDDDYAAQRRHADALATAIIWSTRAVAGLVRMAAAVPRRALDTSIVWRRRARGGRELRSLDDRALRDIGLSRYDALHAARKPFWRP